MNLEAAQQYLKEAKEALKADNRQLAKQLARHALSQDPYNVKALLILGGLSEPRASLVYIMRALEIAPEDDYAQQAMAWAVQRLRKVSAGRWTYEHALPEISLAKPADLARARHSLMWLWPILIAIIAILIQAFISGISNNRYTTITTRSFRQTQNAILVEDMVTATLGYLQSLALSKTPTPTGTLTPTATNTFTPTPTGTPTPTETPVLVIDLSLAKQVSNATPSVGNTVTFTLVVANAGPSTATNIAVTDVVPSGYSYVAASISGGDVRNADDPYISGLTWTINSLASGDSVSLTYRAVVQASGTYNNYAEITSADQTDSDSTPGNNSTTEDDDDTVTVSPLLVIDLSLDKQVSNPNPKDKDTITFTLVVANAGPSTATNITVTDVVPNGYTYVAASIAGGDVRNDTNPATSGLKWTINSLASGASRSLTYQAVVLKSTSGTYDNYAEITSADQTDSDSTPGNNSTTEDDDDIVTVTPTFL